MGNWKPLFASVCIGMALLGCTSKEMPKKEADQVSEGEIQQISWVKEPFAAYETDPIALYDKGFLVNDGNKEGFINAKGDLLLAMKYKFQACFMDDAYGVMEGGDGDLKYLSQLLYVEGYDQGCWTGIIGPQTSYYVDEMCIRDSCYRVKETMYQLEANLYERGFLRVHKAFIVNKKDIRRIRSSLNSKFTLILTNRCV